ncbi:MAG: hypothetical protein ACLTY5_11385 [Angelakisella sp.]
MEKIYENIINEGKATGKAIEAINAELKAAGANFHLNPDGGVANWTEDEMREGFIPAEKEPEALPPDAGYPSPGGSGGHRPDPADRRSHL